MKRRTFLLGGGATLAAGGFLWANANQVALGDLASRPKLSFPPLIDARNAGQFALQAQSGQTSFFSGRSTPTLGFNQSYLGPVVKLAKGEGELDWHSHENEDEFLYINTRARDLILRNAENVYPVEIEHCLELHPEVVEAAVIGVPHPDFGETVLGVLVAAPDAQPDLDAITAAAGASLARFKQPRKLIVVDALPRNTMGKVQKNVLRDQFAELFTAQQA